MRTHGTIMSSAQVLELLKAECTDFVEALKEKNGIIVAVIKKNLTFDRSKLAQMNSKLTSAGYDQFSLRMNTDGTFTIADGTQLEHDLAEWVDKEGGCARKAADQIKTAFYQNEASLNLSYLSLETLPKAILSPLTNLNSLNVSGNQLTDLELPDAYTNLQSLDVSGNRLTDLKLPDAYTNLQSLDLSSNQLTDLKLPNAYTKLQSLDVSDNKLTTLELPDTYTNLTHLFLSNNQLTTLEFPDAYMNLEIFDVAGNPNLCTLPLSLGECYNLTTIDAEDTSISEDLVNQILATCQARRNAEAAQILPQRLQVWSTAAANKQFDFSFIENFSQEEIQSLSEWLLRLERTKDFNSSYQQGLAFSACQMVLSLNTDSEFKEQFFAQVNANLEGCDDRAAMSFNEIFLAWKLTSLVNPKSEDQEQLNLMIAAAKTLTLRKAIAKKCAKRPGQEESVEIYLYYESALREKLNLLTAIHEMSYPTIGKREWMNEEELEEHVNANYLEALCDLPSFKEMAKKDASCGLRLSQLQERMFEQLDEIETEKETKEDAEYKAQCDSLTSQYNSKEKKILEKWAKEKIERM